ncbi:hypothetical protein BMT54_03500 [Pasteurellaceae bacterium 15-036681]|nr:hypothetical protein BMT54_03500 [Pasteurellaceae bacterium 15-036681]
MVNLVLVSHSYTLACGVAELAEQMNHGCQIAIAAGIEEPENAIGTDAVRIMSAIEQVYSPDGVVILMDLGSAILSAETALDLIDPEMAQNVKLCAAPLVEGTMAAVVSASAGASLTEVITEAENALIAKRGQLGTQETSEAQAVSLPSEFAKKFTWTVQNPNGIHARPAAKVIETIAPFSAKVWAEVNQQIVDARSYNQLIQLQIRAQQQVTFYVEGSDAEQALEALRILAENHFGEEVNISAQAENKQFGQPILPEFCVGQAVVFEQNFAKNWQNLTACVSLEQAVVTTQQQLSILAETAQLPDAFRGIFQAHQLLLDEIVEEMQSLLAETDVISACQQQFAELIKQYQSLDDPYLQARSLDLEDLRDRLICNLLNQPIPVPELSENSLLCAKELYPSTLVSLLTKSFKGILLTEGSRYSHTALIAQAAGIPMMVQVNHKFENGSEIRVNWIEGWLV